MKYYNMVDLNYLNNNNQSWQIKAFLSFPKEGPYVYCSHFHGTIRGNEAAGQVYDD